MTAIANIVINDGANTPVAHTFAPVTTDGQRAEFADRSAGVPLGYNTLVLSVRPPVKDGLVYKTVVEIKTPILEAATGPNAQGFTPAPTWAYGLVARLEILSSTRSTLQNRKDLLAFMRNALANSAIQSAIYDFEPIY